MLDSYSTRFWSKVDRSGGPSACWFWLGSRLKAGYGKFSVKHQTWDYAHRVSYRLTYGEIAPGHIIMHTCDNPSCVNPDHLKEATQADNVADKMAKGRGRVGDHTGANNPRAVLNESQVRLIKRRLANGEPCTAIATDLSIARWLVYEIKWGNTWKHIE